MPSRWISFRMHRILAPFQAAHLLVAHHSCSSSCYTFSGYITCLRPFMLHSLHILAPPEVLRSGCISSLPACYAHFLPQSFSGVSLSTYCTSYFCPLPAALSPGATSCCTTLLHPLACCTTPSTLFLAAPPSSTLFLAAPPGTPFLASPPSSTFFLAAPPF
jgi:hypothetical protein